MKRLAVLLGSVAALVLVASVVVIGIGIAHSQKLLAAAAVPLPATPIEAGDAVEAQGPAPVSSGVSNLSPDLIASLPGYAEAHDRETYIRVQTWIRICMRDQFGYSYAFTLAPEEGDIVGFVALAFMPAPDGWDQSETQALYGNGGCYDEAVHKAGVVGTASFTAGELAQIDELYGQLAYPEENPWGWAGETPGFAAPVDRPMFQAVQDSISACMAAAGWQWVTQFDANDDGVSPLLLSGIGIAGPLGGDGLTEAQFAPAFIALYGPRSHTSTYDWTTGGCYGRAIHEAGVSGAD